MTAVLLASLACNEGRRSAAATASPATSGVQPAARAAAPADTLSDEEVRVVVDSATTLAGTLSWPRPRRVHAVPAVLLIGGSGPQDRDGTRAELPGYAPWRDVAAALVASGFAVLRLDDRGTAASTGRFAGATTDDFARDAAAAVSWLRRRARVDGARIALVGHSEGAVVAMLVAAADPAIRALVLLGAPSRSGREIARWQRDQLVGSDLAQWPPNERAAVLAAADAEADALAARDPWLHRWFALDPRAVAARVRQPVLLVHGTNDRQVPPSHADELAAVLRAAGATSVQMQRVAGTNHLLLVDHDGDPQGYVRLAERRVQSSILAATTHFLSVHTTLR